MGQLRKTFFVLAGVLVFGSAAFAQGQAKQNSKVKKAEAPLAPSASGDPAASPKKEDEKLDITDLEQKYWSAKDTDFTVVQNRAFPKEKRVALSLTMGPLVNDPYSEGFNYGLSASYFTSERYGIELSATQSNLKFNKTVEEFRNIPGNNARTVPDHNRVTGNYSLGLNWVPIYAKMSLLGSRILYFDLMVTPSIGVMSYEQILDRGNSKKSGLSLGLDFTQLFFLSRSFAVRVDLKNRWFNQQVLVYDQYTQRRKENMQATYFLFGFTYFFN